MAADDDNASTPNKLCLRHFGMEDETERGDRFWNTNSEEIKFSAKKQWIRRVRFAEKNPTTGWDLDPVLEELTGNKLELVSPLVDGFLKEIGLSINAKPARSRMTGLMAPIMLFMPFQIFRHIWVFSTRLRGKRGNNQEWWENHAQLPKARHGRENLVSCEI